MIFKSDCTLPTEYLEQLGEEGLERLPDRFLLLVNEIMHIERENYLGAKPYQRSKERGTRTDGGNHHRVIVWHTDNYQSD